MWRHRFLDRRKRLVTQREVEKRLGWPVGTIGSIEDGRLRLHPDQERELDQLLDQIEAEQRQVEQQPTKEVIPA